MTQLFCSEKFDCYHCHAGTNFTTTFVSKNTPTAPRDFRNNGLYNTDGKGAYPPNNTGLFGFTQFENDMGKFRVPTLRNIGLTAPYFHDGSAATLDDVLASYAHGGRLITAGPFAGDGSLSPHRDPLVKGFVATEQELRRPPRPSSTRSPMTTSSTTLISPIHFNRNRTQ